MGSRERDHDHVTKMAFPPPPRMVLVLVPLLPIPLGSQSLLTCQLTLLPGRELGKQARVLTGAPFHKEVPWAPSATVLAIRANLSTFSASFLKDSAAPAAEISPREQGSLD